jgi:drug/metabolite transporter (DMT)-like permease
MSRFHGITLIVLCTLFTSLAQLVLKYGSGTLFSITNLIGITLYGLGFILFIHALKHGEVTSLFPVLSTSYIWVLILAIFFLGETFTSLKLLGTIVIVSGIILISLGGTT